VKPSRPSPIPVRNPRVHRIDATLAPAREGLTHERIALTLGISPLRLLLLCERHGIDVRRAPGPRPVCLVPTGGKREEQRGRAVSGRRCASEERAEAQRVDRETFGGYVRDPLRSTPTRDVMVWKPGVRKVCEAFTVASLYAGETGAPIEYHPPPLASLGEVAVEHKPVVPGPKRKNPAGSWGGLGAQRPAGNLKSVELPEERAGVRARNMRVAKTAKPSKRAEVRA
jgi:hypothetical protein